MPSSHELRPRTRSASTALLSAALGGLLSLAGCSDPGATVTPPAVDAATDTARTAAATDTATDTARADASPADASAPDVSTADASAPDASATDSAVVDASAPDASATDSAVVDASPADVTVADAGPSLDASADAASDVRVEAGPFPFDVARPDARRADPDAGCDVVPTRLVTYTDAATGISLETFTAACDSAGGYVEIHPHCGGANSCAGFSIDTDRGQYSEHTCAGLNTCTGFSCVIPP